MEKKEVYWEGDTLKTFAKVLPEEVQMKFALDLDAISEGEQPYSKIKQLKGVGHGIMELIKNGKPAYRLVYSVKANKVHVLYIFSKTSNGTDSKHIETIKSRVKSL